MNNMLRNIIGFLGALVMISCSMPETKIYSLHMPAENVRPQTKKQTVITLKVQSPRYLSQPYIAHRLSEYQLDISRYAKWDSAPSEMVRDAFRDSLSAVYQDVRVSTYVKEDSVVLTVNLKHFERVNDGHAELAFDALLHSVEGKEIYRIDVDKTVKIETKDSTGLAKALSAALTESVREVLKGVSSKL